MAELDFVNKFNNNESGFSDSGSNQNIEKMLLEITDVEAKIDTKSQFGSGEYLVFTLVDKEKGVQIKQREYLRKDDKGSIKSPIYPGFISRTTGEEVPGSVTWEMLHLAKELDPEAYDKRKEEFKVKFKDTKDSWLRKEFFVGLKFELNVKIVEAKEDVFFIPQFTKTIVKEKKKFEEQQVDKAFEAHTAEQAATPAKSTPF